MQQPSIHGLLTVIFGLIILIAPISATTATITPDPISENAPITVSIKDLPDNSTFMIKIEASVPLDAANRFSMSTNNLQVPFALNGGRIALHAESVKTANLSAQMGGGRAEFYGEGENGIVDIILKQDIPQGLVQYITLDGEGTAGTTRVTTSMDLSGKKVGPENADMTLTVSGLNGGTVGVKIYVNGTLVPTSETTTVPTAVPTTSSSGGSSDGGDSGSTVPTTPTTTKIVTVSSLDRGAVLTFDEGALSGARTGDLAIMVSNRAVPEKWEALAGPYAILPSDASFKTKAKITLDLNRTGIDKDESLIILGFSDGTWKPIPSRINGSNISAEISEAGEFAIVTPVSAEPETPVPAGTTKAAAGGVTTDTTATPRTATSPAPTQSPLPIWCALGALAIALIAGRRH
jgi:hypothetical protein